jgi:hypothetical protein
MAFVLPFLLVVIFGIIEFGYLIFAYSTVSQAARNGAEAAAQLPPYPSWLSYKSSPPSGSGYPGFRGDPCTNTVLSSIETDTTIFGSGSSSDIIDFVTISYPNGADSRNLTQRGPVEVTIAYPVRGITPLFQLLNLNGNGTITLRVTQRRSIENLGADPTRARGVACAKDLADYKDSFAKQP